MKVTFLSTLVSAFMLLAFQSIGAEPDKGVVEKNGNIYQFANQCYLVYVSASNSYLSKTDKDYALSRDTSSATKFYMRPAALGVYLLFDQD
ncbi:MAG: hypothetical protein OSA45_17365, partial [Halioglobus sp.]|nr:hypothetical protein [Halioglobus sp.]